MPRVCVTDVLPLIAGFSLLLTSPLSATQNPNFLAGRLFPASQNDSTVAHAVAGDFNGDGKTDLVTVTFGQTDFSISIALGNGDGTFQLPSTIMTGPSQQGVPVTIASGDFNGDGKLDFAHTPG